jgi:hypothetical protein
VLGSECDFHFHGASVTYGAYLGFCDKKDVLESMPRRFHSRAH